MLTLASVMIWLDHDAASQLSIICVANERLVKVCLRWKGLIYQCILSVPSRSPASVGAEANQEHGEDITVFSFESVWCYSLWWFRHYFMSIIKKTSNKMLHSQSDHRTWAKTWCVFSKYSLLLSTCSNVCLRVRHSFINQWFYPKFSPGQEWEIHPSLHLKK